MKCRVIEKFTLKDFDKIKITKRKMLDTYGRLYVDDEFECNEEMAKYLTGGNDEGKVVVKIVEVKQEPKLKSKAVNIEENVIPLDKNHLEELGKKIEQYVVAKPTNKKKKVEK